MQELYDIRTEDSLGIWQVQSCQIGINPSIGRTKVRDSSSSAYTSPRLMHSQNGLNSRRNRAIEYTDHQHDLLSAALLDIRCNCLYRSSVERLRWCGFVYGGRRLLAHLALILDLCRTSLFGRFDLQRSRKRFSRN